MTISLIADIYDVASSCFEDKGASSMGSFRTSVASQHWPSGSLAAVFLRQKADIRYEFQCYKAASRDRKHGPRATVGFPHTIETGSRKAITAASRREATTVIEAENAHEATLGAVFNGIGLITLSGGIPILYDSEVIGVIGIAGSVQTSEAAQHPSVQW